MLFWEVDQEGVNRALQRRRIIIDKGQVAYFAVANVFILAIEVHFSVAVGGRLPLLYGVVCVLTQQVHHDGGMHDDRIDQGQAADGANVLLELRRLRPLERPVAGIVDTWRDLVDDEGFANKALALCARVSAETQASAEAQINEGGVSL